MKKLWNWFLDWWNEIDPIQEAILADYDNWIKQKQKTKQKMAKYRIAETYKYSSIKHPAPTYIIQEFTDDGNYWVDIYFSNSRGVQMYYHNKEEVQTDFDKLINLLKEAENQIGDKVVYETEI
jgi:hypothetical protein